MADTASNEPADSLLSDRHMLDRWIADRIFLFRQHRFRSQAALAQAAGIPVEDLIAYEAGEKRIPSERLLALARALDCTLTALLPGAGDAGL